MPSQCPATPGRRARPFALLLSALSLSALAETPVLPEMTVTGTREARALNETPASVGVVSESAVRLVRPSHPAQILNQVPGAAAGVTNGEGHNTAIRQPFTTNPVYLFLEDGIPIRSTGFFNHNALYEINLPQSGGLEVTRGPGTALYGSDAIGGTVNVLSRTPPAATEFSLLGEAGSFGWRRVLASGGSAVGDDAWIVSGNRTQTDGWRDWTAYERSSLSARWDRALDANTVLKMIVSHTTIDQETGANSPLTLDDYVNNPTRNYKPIAFRAVKATRLSAAWERESGNRLISLTPYVRDNGMDLLASFRLTAGATGDNTISHSTNQSYGVQAKWREDFPEQGGRLITGVDVEVSPGGRQEDRIDVTVSGAGASRVYSAYTMGARVYDYDVTFSGVSPYVHGELAATDRLRLSGGLRYDRIGYVFRNHIGATVSATSFYGQAPDTTARFGHLSPKFGFTYMAAAAAHVYGSLNHSFRAPSEGDLFRPASDSNAARAALAAQSALTLKPVKADQAELGVRGRVGAFHYDVVAYELRKTDDILTYTDPLTNVRSSSNNGSTRHRGVEAALGYDVNDAWRLDLALSSARHRYQDWSVPNGGASLSGKDISAAPRTLANGRLTWTPRPATQLQLEWVHVGAYWRDDANTAQYDGHNLFNLRGTVPLAKGLALSGTVSNLTDRRYADSAGISSGVPVASPGLPRALYLALEATW